MSDSRVKSTRTGWVYADQFLLHNATIRHPECPDRLRAIAERLESDGIAARLQRLQFEEASVEDIGHIHTLSYIDDLNRAEGQWWDSDTFVGPDSPRIARLAAGGVLAAVRRVWNGELVNALCTIRPPGHHALADRAMGFCLFNNVAVAAADVLSIDPRAKVLIIDLDVHHGNGTQAIFYESDSVMYASVHQFPFYPGTGASDETGRGDGVGYTVNMPLPAGAGDVEFLNAIDRILDGPALQFDPDIVIVSAGFDAHRHDPLANLNVTVDGFAGATRRVCQFAEAVCGGKLVSVLEGGYNISSLAASVAAHVSALMDSVPVIRKEFL